jgi:hypothetical protein
LELDPTNSRKSPLPFQASLVDSSISQNLLALLPLCPRTTTTYKIMRPITPRTCINKTLISKKDQELRQTITIVTTNNEPLHPTLMKSLSVGTMKIISKKAFTAANRV